MKDKFLKQIFKAFEMMNRCWDGEGGAASGSDGGKGGDNTGGDAVVSPPIVEPYIGSKELNPDQRPLRMNIEGYDNQAIDDLIDVTDPDECFLTDEEIVAMDKAAKEKGDKDESGEKKKPADKIDDKSDDKGDDKGDKDESGEEDLDVKHFYDTTGLTQEEFQGLSDTAQKNIHDKVFGDPSTSEADSEKISKLETDKKSLSDSLKALEADPIISARLDEHATGKSYVAKSIPGVTTEQADAILDAGSVEEATKLINKFFTENVTEAVKIERGHTDAKSAKKEAIKKSNAVITSLGEIDPRLKFDEIDWFVEDFNVYSKNEKFADMVAMTKIIREKGITTPEQIKALGKEDIYAIVQRANGWDKDRDDKIVKNAKKDILEILKNPRMAKSGKKAAASLIQTGRDVNIKESINRNAVIEELKNGNPATFHKLAEEFEGDIKMTEELGKIQREGALARQEFLKDKT